MYSLFLLLHLLCAAIWVGLGVVTLLTDRFRGRSAGTLGELYLMRSTLIYAAIMGNIGGIGILITGPGLAGIEHLPWFAFNGAPWLAIKQLIFVIVLAMTFGLQVPMTKKVRARIAEEMAGAHATHGASDGLRSSFAQLVRITHIMQILVLINVILGVLKPMFGAGAM